MPKPNRAYGRSHIRTSIDRSRVAWATGENFEVVLYKGERARTDDDEEYEPHEAELNGLESIRLLIKKAGNYTVLDLSLMTVEEIDALAYMVDLAVRTARPVAEQLDKAALDAVQHDADRIPMRAYRLAPRIVVRDPELATTDTEGTHDNHLDREGN